ncbi:uncharacterized protein LY89DRAFT_726923 [Mollisia scopiformis]|uniref:Uncharacterized protein n=1 Tax=Mollisia scopiformis TaxID=149040 RepID=A0A194XUQ6_MOLSC|nr:uncharacterized protein LY89DRAFT_726923 [Mollisia scopiformis]KUJ23871.1 hypothetical protein LY89DRAFT_726923 [Mollisia scopiformis]
MVSTRLQTGAISTRKYTPLSITLHDLSLTSPTSPTRPNNRKNGSSSPTKILKPVAGRKGSLKSSTAPKQKLKSAAARLTSTELELLDTSLRHSTGKTRETVGPFPATPKAKRSQKLRARNAQKVPADMCPGNAVFPSAIFGAREEVGLSKIGRANKEVKLWEEILVTHQENVPDLVPIVEERLQGAKTRRACLDDKLLANLQVGDMDPAASAIKARLQILQYGLDTSKFKPESRNIKCAMAAYKSGAIGYQGYYTIIYAGHVVDTAPTYGDFVCDRTERLDRYFAIHGEGWMWYEPPLKVHPDSTPKALATATLPRTENWSGLGAYYVNQGFWKRSGFVRRMAQTAQNMQSNLEDTFVRDPVDPMKVDCQQDGPRLCYRSMMDSGATFPTLHNEDLVALGISSQDYGAQSMAMVQTAAGPSYTRMWELFVCVLDENGKQLVNAFDAVYPLSHHYLGGLCPVMNSLTNLQYDEQGIEIPARLSGMVPFTACYVSSTPTRNYMFLGEDRNDVLGSHRMPGQKKWAIEMDAIEPGMPFDRYGNPKTSFNHRDGLITDVDHPNMSHCSTITFLGGQPDETVIVSNPSNVQFMNRVSSQMAAGSGP